MYRPAGPYLTCSKDIFKKPLQEIFKLISNNGWQISSISSNPKALVGISLTIRTELKKTLLAAGKKRPPSDLMIDKILLGIFSPRPAMDQFVLNGLDVLSQSTSLPIDDLTKGFSLRHFEAWVALLQKIEELEPTLEESLPFLPSQVSSYPTSRKFDLLLWALGQAFPGKI